MPCGGRGNGGKLFLNSLDFMKYTRKDIDKCCLEKQSFFLAVGCHVIAHITTEKKLFLRSRGTCTSVEYMDRWTYPASKQLADVTSNDGG